MSCVTKCNADAECAHERDAVRALTGTWVIFEVWLAVQKSYEVIDIFEMYEYAVTKYDLQTGQGALFFSSI